jgi:hypothetical protein
LAIIEKRSSSISDRRQGESGMPLLSVTEIKSSTISDDGTAVTLTCVTKYSGNLDVSMPVSCVDRMIEMLQEMRGTPKSTEDLPPNQLRVKVPKTWAITADAAQHGLVILIFDHQAETRTGYALKPDAARKMSEGLATSAKSLSVSGAATRQ